MTQKCALRNRHVSVDGLARVHFLFAPSGMSEMKVSAHLAADVRPGSLGSPGTTVNERGTA